MTSVQKIRDIELAIAGEYALQRMRCPIHLSVGSESLAADVCAALDPTDLVLAHHRCHAAYIAKGGSVQALKDELHGLPTGCTEGRGGSMHLSDMGAGFLAAIPVVGAVLPIAAGVAMAEKGTGKLVAVFVGDAAMETGVFWETVNLMRLYQLPLLICIEDNALSVDTPASERRGMTLGYSTDVIAAVAAARKGVAPLLGRQMQRACEHCGPRLEWLPALAE